MLNRITLTGADQRTGINDLERLVADFAPVEVGLLYTTAPDGRPRYPELSWLLSASKALEGRCAIHVCGRAARSQLLEGKLDQLVSAATRVQINGLLSDVELNELSIFFALRHQDFITQHNDANKRHARGNHTRHCLLVDGSGGQGLSPQEWLRPETVKAVGFAGGLGPDNLAAELPKIAAVAAGPSWVDMEGKLRRDDWFDIGLARECAAVMEAFLEGATPGARAAAAAARRRPVPKA